MLWYQNSIFRCVVLSRWRFPFGIAFKLGGAPKVDMSCAAKHDFRMSPFKIPPPKSHQAIYGTRIEHKVVFFSSFSGAPGISRQKSRDIPPESIFSLLSFEGHAELYGLRPFTWKTPTPPEHIRTKKFDFVLLFVAWQSLETNPFFGDPRKAVSEGFTWGDCGNVQGNE